MKYKTTAKAVKAGYVNVLVVGYGDLQHLLRFQDPVAYTSGVYGWNADIYEYGHNAICTGYRPFGNLHVSYDLIRMYDDKAREIVNDYNMTYGERSEKVNTLLDNFMQEVVLGQ